MLRLFSSIYLSFSLPTTSFSDELTPSLYMVWMNNLVRLLVNSDCYDEAAMSQCLLCAYILEIGHSLAHYINKRDTVLANAPPSTVSPLLDPEIRIAISRELRADLEEQCERCGWIPSMKRIIPNWKLHTPRVSFLYFISFLL